VSIASFAGTVTLCCTRYEIKKSLSAYLTHFDARWILTIAIDAADAGLPFAAGDEEAFVIHSPAQLLHDSDKACVGKHYRFTVERDEAAGTLEWITLQRA
jgi:hypothetical protein